MATKKHYEIADKAWQPVVGCSPSMPCAPRCWARRTVARIVECQKPTSPERSEFFQIALTPDGQKWSGVVQLDEAHLLDPLKWRKPAVIATGFHGDWGRLTRYSQLRMLAVMSQSPQHQFMPLSKVPEKLAETLSAECLEDKVDDAGESFTWCHANAAGRFPLKNTSIGCSVMNQHEADKMRPAMTKIATRLGWRTHCWYEPALGPVNWQGWEFLELLIMGGESGAQARPCDIGWFRESIAWCRANGVKPFMKQLGAVPVMNQEEWKVTNPLPLLNARNDLHAPEGSGLVPLRFSDRKGGDMQEWPEDLRVREFPG